jgi:hypothetical protein
MSTPNYPDRNERPTPPPSTQSTDGATSAPRGATAPAAVPVEKQASLREDVLERERNRFGGVKVGSAFFGWLTATGTAVLLTALVAAAGAAVGLGLSGDVNSAANAASQNAQTVGLVGAISLIVIMLIAYYCGGYVAGRMARFDGAKQGVAVWLWAIVIAIVVAIVAAIAGSQFNILANVNGFPRIPINEGTLTAGSIVTAVLVALAGLIGAVLGGIAGMRFHRRVDRAGLGR